MGFAQAGRQEQISAIYRYSNSVGGDPVSESTFCYKLYSVFLMGSSTGRDVIYDPHLRKARTLAEILQDTFSKSFIMCIIPALTSRQKHFTINFKLTGDRQYGIVYLN